MGVRRGKKESEEQKKDRIKGWKENGIEEKEKENESGKGEGERIKSDRERMSKERDNESEKEKEQLGVMRSKIKWEREGGKESVKV